MGDTKLGSRDWNPGVIEEAKWGSRDQIQNMNYSNIETTPQDQEMTKDTKKGMWAHNPGTMEDTKIQAWAQNPMMMGDIK